LGAGEEMKDYKEDKDDETEKELKKRDFKTKEQILDESFKKAETEKIGKPEKKEEPVFIKKPFIKIGIFITIIAVIGVVYVNFLPLMYINYDTDIGTMEEFFTYDDFRFEQIESDEISSIFDSTCFNCSKNSDAFIGLTLDDLINTPKFTIYIFIFLAIIGIIFTIFVTISRLKNYSEEKINLGYSIFISLIIITGIIIFVLNVKFLGSHLLYQLNKPFINELGISRAQMFFFTPYVSVLFSFVFFIIGIAFMRININKALLIDEFNKSQKLEISYRYGSNI
jgi:hypothetical protein